MTTHLLDVVAVLLDQPARTGVHGYDIARRTGLYGPTVYRILGQMERMGWTSREVTEPRRGNPPRHLHTLTAEGRQAATLLVAARQTTTTTAA